MCVEVVLALNSGHPLSPTYVAQRPRLLRLAFDVVINGPHCWVTLVPLESPRGFATTAAKFTSMFLPTPIPGADAVVLP